MSSNPTTHNDKSYNDRSYNSDDSDDSGEPWNPYTSSKDEYMLYQVKMMQEGIIDSDGDIIETSEDDEDDNDNDKQDNDKQDNDKQDNDNDKQYIDNSRGWGRDRSPSPPPPNRYQVEVLIRVPNRFMDKLEDCDNNNYFHGYEKMEKDVYNKFKCRIRISTTHLNDGRSTMVSICSKKILNKGAFDMIQNTIMKQCGQKHKKKVYKESENDTRIKLEVEIDSKSIPFVIGTHRSNIKRICSMFTEERGIFIKCPNKKNENNNNKFIVYAQTQETAEKMKEELLKSAKIVNKKTDNTE